MGYGSSGVDRYRDQTLKDLAFKRRIKKHVCLECGRAFSVRLGKCPKCRGSNLRSKKVALDKKKTSKPSYVR